MEWTDLKEWVGVNHDQEDVRLQSMWVSAVSMVDLAVSGAWRPVPEEVLNLMYLEVGAQLYERRNAPVTNSQFVGYEGNPVPVRMPRDPLTTIRPILNKYVTQI